MIIETKYNLGDFVYVILRKQKSTTVDCSACSGTGRITLNNGKDRSCPECYGRRTETTWEPEAWALSYESSGNIGRIGVERYAVEYQDMEDVTQYMLNSTGVGSGTLWKEERLFLTVELAQAECDRLNEEDGNV